MQNGKSIIASHRIYRNPSTNIIQQTVSFENRWKNEKATVSSYLQREKEEENNKKNCEINLLNLAERFGFMVCFILDLYNG